MRSLKMSLVVFTLILLAGRAKAVSIEWVTVGDVGNLNDIHGDGYGGVDYAYRIGKHEVTNAQYTEFLNAVAKTDTNDLYFFDMGVAIEGGISRTGTSGSYQYNVRLITGGPESKHNWPVNYTNFYSALRFANWLHNGKPSGDQDAATTEDGAYDLSLESNVVRKEGATFFVPNEDEWYKAAYYKGGGTNAGYWDYATQSNTVPVSEAPPGGNNSANYDPLAVKTPWGIQGVGAYTNSLGKYGTFDQNGNVWEWIEDKFDVNDRVNRGGAFASYGAEFLHADSRFHASASGGIGGGTGFRVARIIPEPSTFGLAVVALVGLLAHTSRRKR